MESGFFLVKGVFESEWVTEIVVPDLFKLMCNCLIVRILSYHLKDNFLIVLLDIGKETNRCFVKLLGKETNR